MQKKRGSINILNNYNSDWGTSPGGRNGRKTKNPLCLAKGVYLEVPSGVNKQYFKI
jgi:hypothetical protein